MAGGGSRTRREEKLFLTAQLWGSLSYRVSPYSCMGPPSNRRYQAQNIFEKVKNIFWKSGKLKILTFYKVKIFLGNIFNVKTFVSFCDWYLNWTFSIKNISQKYFYFYKLKKIVVTFSKIDNFWELFQTRFTIGICELWGCG